MEYSREGLVLAQTIFGARISMPESDDLELNVVGQREELLQRVSQKPELFDYQRELANDAINYLGDGKRALISLPTGGGKTRTAAFVVLDYFSKNPKSSIVWMAPTMELLDQAHDTISNLWAGFGLVGDILVSRDLSKLLGSSNEVSKIWLCTPQAANAKMQDVEKAKWALIVFDEAHQVAAPTFKKAVEQICESNSGTSLIGLSATPGRSINGQVDQLAAIFNGKLLVSSTLGKHPVNFLQQRGILSRLDFKLLNDGDNTFLSNIERLKISVKKISELARLGQRSLVFTSSVVESEALTMVLKHSGITSHHVDGRQSDNSRRFKLHEFASGKAMVVTNQKLLTTGYDCPAVSNVFLTARVTSPILFEQMVGRAARGPRTGGSRRSNIWQFEDHLTIHGLPQSYYRYLDYEWN
jgi:DNA repair protein RadD